MGFRCVPTLHAKVLQFPQYATVCVCSNACTNMAKTCSQASC